MTQFIATLRFGPENFDSTDEGSLSNYLGVEIEKLPFNCGFKMTQPFPIQRLVDTAEIDTRMTKSRPTPAISLLLAKDEDGPDRKHSWNYRTLTGMLGYLFAFYYKA